MRSVWGWLAVAVLALLAGGLGWWSWTLRAPTAQVVSLVVPPAFVLARDFSFDTYRLAWSGRDLELLDEAGRSLWRTNGAFLSAGKAEPALRCDEQSLEGFQVAGGRLQVFGHLRCTDGRVSTYRLAMQAEGERGVRVSVIVGDPALDRLTLRWQQEPDERFRGFSDAATGSESAVSVPVVEGRWMGEPSRSLLLISSHRAFQSGVGTRQFFGLESAGVVSLEVEAGSLELRVARAMP
ncbi:hypothetical protein A7D27_15300 [Pseudomonas sp. 1D4]|uniref:hypothetical protein n=1 Tax=unclassified Pseudomonas TaxID=196821 RepID=UPI00084A9C28|nr:MULTISPECIES: hypothetical protein [unclassified Pseudomonas]OEC40823.1 hypothetical protein A7D27_15300 [Pseudomonas sp. 1D4]OEC56904.1 hypothetical protein A9G05_16200 [Pseudomonas sp. ENNP23]